MEWTILQGRETVLAHWRPDTKTFYNTNFSASLQHGWNVIVDNVTASAVFVSWLPLKTNSTSSTAIYGYIAVCLQNSGSDILLLNVENASSFNTLVRNLRPYTKYQAMVIALVKDRVTGVITLKSSDKLDFLTQEDGKKFSCYTVNF